MSDLIRELYFADAFYYKDFENSSEMNKELTNKILRWKHYDPEGVEISNSLGWQSRSTMQEQKDAFDDITNKIIRSGDIDINTIGQYIITYTVTDSSGNISTEEKSILDKVYKRVIESLEQLNTKKEEYIMNELNSFDKDQP